MLHDNSPLVACHSGHDHTDVAPDISKQTAGTAPPGRSEDSGGHRGGAPGSLDRSWEAVVPGRRPAATSHSSRPGAAPGPALALSARAPLQSRVLVTFPRPQAQHTAFLGVFVREDACGLHCVVTGWLPTNTHPTGRGRRGPRQWAVL